MRFFSDNAAAACPEVLAALAEANLIDTAYDGDQWSKRLDAAFSALFEREVAALWVATGTAANSLALAALCPPHGSILCHRDAHIQNDECGAPEFYTGGAKLLLGEGEGAKLTPAAVTGLLATVRDDVHQAQPAALSITNATEYGLVYTPGETAALGALCRERGLRFHVDGARFANAVARLGCAPADLAWRAGVDALSFGFVKNGGLSAEALILFDPALGRSDPFPPQARRPPPVQGALSRRPDPGDARRRPLAAQRPRRQRGRRLGSPPRPAPTASSSRSRRTRRSCASPRTRRRRCARKASTFTIGVPAKRGW